VKSDIRKFLDFKLKCGLLRLRVGTKKNHSS
jgi:hypothetical protein